MKNIFRNLFIRTSHISKRENVQSVIPVVSAKAEPIEAESIDLISFFRNE